VFATSFSECGKPEPAQQASANSEAGLFGQPNILNNQQASSNFEKKQKSG
jgi:hypothetical protein